MGLYGGPVEKLNKLLSGKIVERVEEPSGDDIFILQVRDLREDGKLGKITRIRISATDLGWWFETQRRPGAHWTEK